MSSQNKDERQRGIILIVVLWTVASLSLLLSTINLSVRTNSAVARAELITAQVESLADAGVELAVARLYVRGNERWKPDGQTHYVRFGGAALRIRITDANALVDLNKADEDVLFAVFKARLGSDRRAQLLRDWVLSERASATGAKRDPIDGSVASARPKDGPPAFIDVSDLLRNPNINAEKFDRLRDLLTVHSRDGKINSLNAPTALLTILPGIGADGTAAILADRARVQSNSATAGDISKPAGSVHKSGEGPAYRVVVEVSGTGLAQPVTMTAIILIGNDGDAPYYGLSWNPFSF